jgi:phytoene dehydrogenase-like protein
MLAGVAAHAAAPIGGVPASAVGLVLAAHAHARGWPIPRGGTQAITDALAADLLAYGGRIETGVDIHDLRQLPPAQATLADVSARGLARLGAPLLPSSYVRRLERFRYGLGVAKVDFALSDAVPWSASELRDSVTLHLGGTWPEVAESERRLHRGQIPDHPYVLVTQPTVVDPSRAPLGKHTLWAYMHVPNGHQLDATEIITREIERYAPGFRTTVLASASTTAREIEERVSANFVGGDIGAGALTLGQLVARPTFSPLPWKTPVPGLYVCSSSTAPGTGVHGLSGYQAARLALAQRFGIGALPALGVDASRSR